MSGAVGAGDGLKLYIRQLLKHWADFLRGSVPGALLGGLGYLGYALSGTGEILRLDMDKALLASWAVVSVGLGLSWASFKAWQETSRELTRSTATVATLESMQVEPRMDLRLDIDTDDPICVPRNHPAPEFRVKVSNVGSLRAADVSLVLAEMQPEDLEAIGQRFRERTSSEAVFGVAPGMSCYVDLMVQSSHAQYGYLHHLCFKGRNYRIQPEATRVRLVLRLEAAVSVEPLELVFEANQRKAMELVRGTT